jgi:hypothetical protein
MLELLGQRLEQFAGKGPSQNASDAKKEETV